MNATANAQPVDNVKPRLGFIDNGYWTPQTAMLESIREWALGWAVGGGWETAARQLGVHHRTFRPRAQWGAPEVQTDDGLFAALGDPQADVLFLAGFDWHSQVLHGSPRWQERWLQCRARKILCA